MKTETIDKLCASYMEDARALKRKFPNREFVLRKVEYAKIEMVKSLRRWTIHCDIFFWRFLQDKICL